MSNVPMPLSGDRDILSKIEMMRWTANHLSIVYESQLTILKHASMLIADAEVTMEINLKSQKIKFIFDRKRPSKEDSAIFLRRIKEALGLVLGNEWTCGVRYGKDRKSKKPVNS